MADTLKIRLSLLDDEFANKLQQDAAAVNALGEKASPAQRSLAQMAEQLAHATTQSSNFAAQSKLLTKQIIDLQVAYSQLSDADKNSTLGQDMIASIDALKAKASDLSDVIADVRQEISKGASDTQTWDAMKQGIEIARDSLSAFATTLGIADDKESAMYQTIQNLARIQTVANAVISIGNALQRQSALMVGIRRLQQRLATIAQTKHTTAVVAGNAAERASAAATAAATTATVAQTAATEGATLAQTAFNVVANANPYVLLATAIVGVVSACALFASSSSDATRAEELQQQKAEKLKKEEEELARKQEELGRAVGTTSTQFYKLQAEYETLTSTAEKSKWIKENANDFNSLGLAISNVNTADEVFVKNSDAVIDALIARAVAAKKAEQAADELIKLEEEKEKAGISLDPKTGKTTYTYKYTPVTESNATLDERIYAKTGKTKFDTYTQQDINMAYDQLSSWEKEAINKRRQEIAKANKEAQNKKFTDREKQLKEDVKNAQKRAVELEKAVAKLGDVKPTNNGDNGIAVIKGSVSYIEELKQKYEEIQHKQFTPDTKGWDEYQQKIDECDAKLAEFKMQIAEKADKSTLEGVNEAIENINDALKLTKDSKAILDLKSQLRDLEKSRKKFEFEAKVKMRAELDTSTMSGIDAAIRSIKDQINDESDITIIETLEDELTKLSKKKTALQFSFDYKEEALKLNNYLDDLYYKYNRKIEPIKEKNYSHITESVQAVDLQTNYKDTIDDARNYSKAIEEILRKRAELSEIQQAAQDAGLVDAYNKATIAIRDLDSEQQQYNLQLQQSKDKAHDLEKQLDKLEIKGIKAEVNKNIYEGLKSTTNGVKSAISSFERLNEVMSDEDATFADKFFTVTDALFGVVDAILAVIQVVQTVTSLMEAANAIAEVTTAATTAQTAATTAQGVAEVAATTETAAAKASAIPALLAFAMANKIATASANTAAYAAIPFAGPALAAAAQAEYTTLWSLAALPFANGGIFTGRTTMGDYNLARVNSGEMILNQGQQGRLFRLLQTGGAYDSLSGGGNVEFKIKGNTLVGVLDNYNKKYSKIR